MASEAVPLAKAMIGRMLRFLMLALAAMALGAAGGSMAFGAPAGAYHFDSVVPDPALHLAEGEMTAGLRHNGAR